MLILLPFFIIFLIKILKSAFHLTILSYRACFKHQIYFTTILKLLSLVDCQKNWTKIYCRILLDLVTFSIYFEFCCKTNYKNDNFVLWIIGKHYTLKDLSCKVLELDRFLSRFLNVVKFFHDISPLPQYSCKIFFQSNLSTTLHVPMKHC